jgi:hypothetical protein
MKVAMEIGGSDGSGGEGRRYGEVVCWGLGANAGIPDNRRHEKSKTVAPVYLLV